MAASFLATALLATAAAAASQPNFVFIITDDQDLKLDSLDYMPALHEQIISQGTTFANHFCTISICCPSRVSLLTGRAAHNTNVTDVSAPYGGYTKFISEGWNDKYLPVWLQEEGYNTYYTGKLMNGLSTSTYNNPYPAGWTDHEFFLDPNTYIYYNVTSQRFEDEPKTYTGNYSTDLAAERTVEYLDLAIEAGKPFFVGVAPIGPHSQTINAVFYPPVPADRHKDLYPGLKVPRTENFNPDVASGASWVKTLEQLNDTVVDYLDEFYRKRMQALKAVDEMVDTIVKRLEESPEVLANTYIIYTTDNGYHVGQHRMGPGKTCAYEEDVHIPFIIRGPGVGKNETVTIPTSHTDIVPTLFQLAGIPLQDEFDGEPFPVTTEQLQQPFSKSESINTEFWGDSIIEGAYPGVGSGISGSEGVNNTWKSVRIIGDGYSFTYVVWCTNEHELYDMTNDPGQMNNLYGTNGTVSGWDIPRLTSRLDTLVLTLKACKGQVCTRPWETLHPQGNVTSLQGAMATEFDSFYEEQQPKVTFSACKLGYLAEFEGAMEPVIYGEYQELRRARWHDFT